MIAHENVNKIPSFYRHFPVNVVIHNDLYRIFFSFYHPSFIKKNLGDSYCFTLTSNTMQFLFFVSTGKQNVYLATQMNFSSIFVYCSRLTCSRHQAKIEADCKE